MSATTHVPTLTAKALDACASMIGAHQLGIDGTDCFVASLAEARRLDEAGLLAELNRRVPDEAPFFITQTDDEKWTLVVYLEGKGFTVKFLGERRTG